MVKSTDEQFEINGCKGLKIPDHNLSLTLTKC